MSRCAVGVINLHWHVRSEATAAQFTSPLNLSHLVTEDLAFLFHRYRLLALQIFHGLLVALLLLVHSLRLIAHQLLYGHGLLLLLLQAHGQQHPQLSNRVGIAGPVEGASDTLTAKILHDRRHPHAGSTTGRANC